MTHWLAVHSDGMERIHHPKRNAPVNGYQFDKTTCARAIVMALYPDRAESFSADGRHDLVEAVDQAVYP